MSTSNRKWGGNLSPASLDIYKAYDRGSNSASSGFCVYFQGGMNYAKDF